MAVDDYPYVEPLPLTSEEDEKDLLDGETLICRGRVALVVCTLICIWGLYAIGFGSFLPHSGNSLLDTVVADNHYKYLVVLLIPTTTYFVIANWVGWQYYQNS